MNSSALRDFDLVFSISEGVTITLPPSGSFASFATSGATTGADGVVVVSSFVLEFQRFTATENVDFTFPLSKNNAKIRPKNWSYFIFDY